MKITKNDEVRTTLLDNIPCGQCFIYYDDLYIKTNINYSEDEENICWDCVRLEDGIVERFSNCLTVQPSYHAEINI